MTGGGDLRTLRRYATKKGLIVKKGGRQEKKAAVKPFFRGDGPHHFNASTPGGGVAAPVFVPPNLGIGKKSPKYQFILPPTLVAKYYGKSYA